MDDIVASLQAQQLQNYLNVGASALYIHTYMLTFSIHVEAIWQGRRGIGTAVYLRHTSFSFQLLTGCNDIMNISDVLDLKCKHINIRICHSDFQL
ncbi:hypothetical protein QCA50_005550 [Cerrena zonata]|uniref:Uncharacterized protein n=1 Tax=Cerrena zonata TaxID=2478898 RepID=A0AAW0GFJ1_9APHY